MSDSAWPAIPRLLLTPPPPPPPDVDGAPEKKSVGVPPLISFFRTCASFEAGGAAVRKKQYVVPPLSQIPGSAPDLGDIHVHVMYNKEPVVSGAV